MMNIYKLLSASFVSLFVFAGSFGVAEAYSVYGANWGTRTVPYYVNTSNSSGLDPAALISDVQIAASTWRNQGQVNLNLSYAGNTNSTSLSLDYKNNVFLRNDTGGYVAYAYYWWDGSMRLIDSDIVLNEAYPQYTSNMACGGGYYIKNTLVHEFGHFIGLNHSDVGGTSMWPTVGGCETEKETLEADDIAGVQSIYPSLNLQSSHINISPMSLSFSADAGVAAVPQSVMLSNSGSATMNWTASANQTWCKVSPTSGSIAVSGSAQIVISADPINVGGTFNCSVAIADSKADNSPQYLTVRYDVIGQPDTTAPTVSITSPASGARVSGSVTIAASASDASGVGKVEFYIDNVLRGTDSSAPYTYKWNVNKQVKAGTHTITVKAYDMASPANVNSATISVVK